MRMDSNPVNLSLDWARNLSTLAIVVIFFNLATDILGYGVFFLFLIANVLHQHLDAPIYLPIVWGFCLLILVVPIVLFLNFCLGVRILYRAFHAGSFRHNMSRLPWCNKYFIGAFFISLLFYVGALLLWSQVASFQAYK